MRIKLNDLIIRNFKGVREYALTLNGKSADIAGDNGTGKTTLYDAFLWGLFGKDSTGKAQFDWKPLDENGKEINHLETEVIIELDIDGKTKKLSRMISENWTKQRGAAVETFTGHSTTFKLDDLTVKKKDYEKEIDALISEDLFKLLTNVSYFAEGIKWNERREILIDMVGDISDADVIAKNKELNDLKELLVDRSADDLKTLTAQNMRAVNKDLKGIPDRIDEVDRSLPDASGLDGSKLNDNIEHLEGVIASYQSEIANLKNSDAVVNAKNKIKEIGLEYREKEIVYKEKLADELQGLKDKKQALNDDLSNLGKDVAKHKENLAMIENSINKRKLKLEELQSNRESLLEQFYKVRDSKIDTFEEHQEVCPTCKQDLPADKVEELKEAHAAKVEEFNQDKAKQLKDINNEGAATAKEIETIENELKDLTGKELADAKAHLGKAEADVTKKTKEVDAVDAELTSRIAKQVPYLETTEAKELAAEAIALEKDTKGGDTTKEEQAIAEKIATAKQEQNKLISQLQMIELHNQQVKRKEELIEQEQRLSVEYGRLEQVLYLLDEFTRSKVKLLTDTINSRFKHVKFRLFEEQINGGLTETCEVTVSGANYSTGLNNAARINAGLDIINTLMQHHNVKVPVFIDNAEGINDIIDIDTQLITLSVSKHKKLNVTTI